MSAPTRPAPPATTRVRIDHAFAILRHYGVAAIPAYGSDPADARVRIATALNARWPYGLGEYAFYTATDGARCFDDAGELRATLTVHHHPAASQVVALALSEAGVPFSARTDDTVVIAPG